MGAAHPIAVDAVVVGGGVAGLWTLDALVSRGASAVLLEAAALGTGQTLWSQGIIHGGLKYTLRGLMTGSAEAIREMPRVWRECLAGRRRPNLRDVRLRGEHCYLWRTDSLRSRAGMIGARVGLRVGPTPLAPEDRPEALRGCPGMVARLDEQVLCPASLLRTLAAPLQDRLLRIDADAGVQFVASDRGVERVRVRRSEHDSWLELAPRSVVLTAGLGSAALRDRLGLGGGAMQRRPLRMVMVRGASLPDVQGHCVDGAHTRVTITGDVDGAGRRVWLVGGQLAEDGAHTAPDALLAHARRELRTVIPGLDTGGAEWSTYDADRAEARTAGGLRPEDVSVLIDQNVITAWPTKLALAPRLADRVCEAVGGGSGENADLLGALAQWPRPAVGPLPWEEAATWTPDAEVAAGGR